MNKNSEMNQHEKVSTKDFLLGAIIGGVVGAATALLVTQKSSKELRDSINDKTASMKTMADSLQKSAKVKVSDIKEITRDKTYSLKQSLSQQSSEIMSNLKKNGQVDLGKDEKQVEYIPIGEVVSAVKEPKIFSEIISDDDEIQKMLSDTKIAFDETERKLNQ